MEVQQDFEELLALLNANSVGYVIVGGYAVAHHGAPRYTGDLDVLVNPIPDNAFRVAKALHEFGFGALDISPDDFLAPGRVVQLGVPPVRIDIVTSITGVCWDDVWNGRTHGTYGNVPVHYIGRQELLANKRAIGRHKDLGDVEALGGEAVQ